MSTEIINWHFRFNNGQPEPVVAIKVGKDKVEVHREVNVLAHSEAYARQRARRPGLDDESGLPPDYALVGTYALGPGWHGKVLK